MARTWVFFLILIQISVNLVYAFIVVNFRSYIVWAIAGALTLYFIIKIGSVGIFVLFRLNKLKCCLSKFDPNDTSRYST